MKVISYSVEYRDPKLGYWKHKITYNVIYKTKTTTRSHKFLWFVWESKHTGIVNQKEAEDEARVIAIERAIDLIKHHGYSVRVQKRHDFGNCEHWVSLVWEDGKFKDC